MDENDFVGANWGGRINKPLMEMHGPYTVSSNVDANGDISLILQLWT